MRHALWLIPADPVRSRLAALIDDLAREHAAPRFDPHVTLLHGIRGQADEVVEAAEDLARVIPALGVALAALRHSPEYYRALFIEVESAGLHRAHRRAAAALRDTAEATFAPHLSLLYAELSPVAREAIVDRIGRALPPVATLDRLDVVDTGGPVEGWSARASVALGGE